MRQILTRLFAVMMSLVLCLPQMAAAQGIDPAARGLAVQAKTAIAKLPVTTTTGRLLSWAHSFHGVGQPAGDDPSPPTLTLGADGAASAITGTVLGYPYVTPGYSVGTLPQTYTKWTVQGGTPTQSALLFINGGGPNWRIRFRFTGRRFEIRLSSYEGLQIGMKVNGLNVISGLATSQLSNNTTQTTYTGANQLLLVDWGPNTQTWTAATAGVALGGAGYAAGDRITLAGGTCTTQPVLGVTKVTSGQINNMHVINPGSCSVYPTGNVAQASTTGSGFGMQAVVVWAPKNTTNITRDIELTFRGFANTVSGFVIDSDATMVPLPIKPDALRFYISGDSETYGLNADNPNKVWARQVLTMLGLDEDGWVEGVSGRGYLAGSPFSNNLSAIIARAPDVLLIPLSVNDNGQTPSVLQAAVTSQLNTLFAALPNLRIICVTGFNENSAQSNAVVAGCQAAMYPQQVATINTAALGIYTGTATSNIISSDATHPSQQGHDTIARQLAPYIAQALMQLVENIKLSANDNQTYQSYLGVKNRRAA